MDGVRELANFDPWRQSLDPWQESLARSRARRGKPMPSSSELGRWQRASRLAVDHARMRRRATRWEPLTHGIAKRPMVLLASTFAILAFALLATALPGASDGLGTRPTARVARDPRAVAVISPAAPRGEAPRSALTAPRAPADCQLVHDSSGYVNPLAGAALTPERIDQGVDYAGSGTLTALGAGRVKLIATSGTGWPGAFIEYRLTAGAAAGCFVFYAEGVTPTPGLQVGDTIRRGQVIATIIPGYSAGIEIGWGAGIGTQTYAAKMGEWSTKADEDNIPTAAGKSFSSLIASLGAPPGKVER